MNQKMLKLVVRTQNLQKMLNGTKAVAKMTKTIRNYQNWI